MWLSFLFNISPKFTVHMFIPSGVLEWGRMIRGPKARLMLPVESVVVWGEALHHEVLDNNEVIQNIFSGYF